MIAATEHTEPNVPICLEYTDVHDLDGNVHLSLSSTTPRTTTHYARHRCSMHDTAATEHVKIGPCIFHWSQVSTIELGVLAKLHLEIESRVRMPVSMWELESDRQDNTPSRSWAGAVETIARCVAAFQNAIDAAQHTQCKQISAKICSCATTLTQKTSPYLRDHLLQLLYDYMQNRTYDLALKNIVNGALDRRRERTNSFWSCSRARRQRSECLDIIQICIDAVTRHGDRMCRDMSALNFDQMSEAIESTASP